MVWLCRDSQISVNTEKVKTPQQQELCVTEHSWLVWWLLALIALCRVFGTCWTHLPQKSLALPKNSGRKKALPCCGCLVFNTDTVDSRGISCSSDSMGSTQGLTALARCVMPPPQHRVLISMAMEVQTPGSSSCRGDMVSLNQQKEMPGLYLNLQFPGLVSMGTGHQKNRNVVCALK